VTQLDSSGGGGSLDRLRFGAPVTGGGQKTVLASWTATVVWALQSNGHDGLALASAAGIDPDELDDHNGRIPLANTTKLWQLAVQATGDPCFGLEVARHVRPSTFGGLSVGVVSSSSFREALERLGRFQSVVLSPSGEVILIQDEDHLSWINRFPPGSERPCPEAMEAIMASITLCGRFLLGRSLSPVAVHLRRPEAAGSACYEAFFRCPVRFGAEEYRLDFAREVTGRELPARSPALAVAGDAIAQTYLNRLPAMPGFDGAVRSVIAHLCVKGRPTAAAIADALAISSRTLQRRLRNEGTTVRALIGEVQGSLACELLVVDRLTVDLVARKLGFHDASSFRRAFKRWTGMTPADYVATAAGGDDRDDSGGGGDGLSGR
jgi:AraC-like DNA-binding protein